MCICEIVRFGLLWSVFVASVAAGEPKLPANPSPPVTALAQATSDGDAQYVTLRLMESLPTTGRPAGRLPPATRWRTVKLKIGDPALKAFDITLKPVTPEQIVSRLQTETPILLGKHGTLDPFHLLTARENTLVVTIAPEILEPPAPPPVESGHRDVTSSIEKALLDLANSERRTAGAPSLTASPLLLKAARQHSANMAKQGELSHTLDGKGVGERLREVEYIWSRCGENIALGARTPAEAIGGWMQSPGHRENLLSKEFTHIGVATATSTSGDQYWTMVLATPLSPP